MILITNLNVDCWHVFVVPYFVLDNKSLVSRQYYYRSDCTCDTALFVGMLDILVFIFL